MDLTIKHYALYLIILGIINKEVRLHAHIVQGKKFYMVFTKGQFWSNCYLMQTYVIFLLPQAIMT